MNMLVQPAPFPEEMDRGYLGRIMRVNGYRTPKDAVEAMAAHFGEEGRSRRDLTTHELLSRMAGMTTEHFAQRHTTLPLRRGITSYVPSLIHGSKERKSLLHNSASLRKGQPAFFCKECVKADVHFHGASYWRRDLQTPGQIWCPKHETPLYFITSDDPFLASPAMSIDEAAQIPQEWVKPAIKNAYVARFIELAAALYDRPSPLDVALIAPLLRDTGSAQGFKVNASSKQGALISDYIKAVFPPQWLSTVFHEVVEKSQGEYLHQVDGTLYLRKSASSVIAYLLVLSVLFESADTAINALAGVCGGGVVSASHRKPIKRSVPEIDELVEGYAIAKGVHAEVARLLDLPVYVVRKSLLELGLPSLPEWTPASEVGPVAALRAFYLGKRSYASCLEISGLSPGRFDALMRQCGPALALALDRMSPKTKGRPRARRVKGRLPSNQEQGAVLATPQLREMLLQN